MLKQFIDKKNLPFLILLALAIGLWLGFIFYGNEKYADEIIHRKQVLKIMDGNFHIQHGLTTFPGYHIVIAAVAKILHSPSPIQTRLISLVFSLFSIAIFFITSRKIGIGNPSIKTLQYVFLPIAFYYFPLIYTDIFSLAILLCALYFAIEKRPTISSIFALLSLLIRQNNIIWVLMLWIFIYIQDNQTSISKEKIIAHLKKTSGFILSFILFAAFVFINQGIAIGDSKSHPVGFYLGNIYFFLAISGLLFLPITIPAIFKLEKAKLKNFVTYAVLPGFIFALLFIFVRPALHEYNVKLEFLRNIILVYATSQYSLYYAFAIFFGFITLFLVDLKKDALLLLLPFIALSLLPSFLVEQRYYIVSIVLILLFRQQKNPKTEYLLISYFLLLSLSLYYLLLKLNIFF